MKYVFYDLDNEVEEVRTFTLFHSYLFEGEVYSYKEKLAKATALLAAWNRANPRRWIYEIVKEEA